MIKRLTILLVLAFMGVAAWFGWKAVQQADGDATRGVYHGNVDIREVRLAFRVSGRVREVMLDEGLTAKAGSLLATLDDAPFRHELAAAEAQAAEARAVLDEARNGSRIEDIARARATLLADEVACGNARTVHARLDALKDSGGVSAQALDDALAAFLQAEARVAVSRASLDLLLAGTRAERIAAAEARVAATSASVDAARTRLADTRLVAPEPGVILTRSIEVGSIVQAGTPAFTLSLAEPVRVRAYVTEPELGLVKPGREVLVRTDSRPEPYHGRIGDVSPRAEFTPKQVETRALRPSLVYRFRVIVTDADGGLRQGMPVSVELAAP